MKKPKTTITTEATISTVRFSGREQLRLVNEIKELAEECGVAYSELLRSLVAIGLAAYKEGAIVGFDGKVVLNTSHHPAPIHKNENQINEVDTKEQQEVIEVNKPKSIFVE